MQTKKVTEIRKMCGGMVEGVQDKGGYILVVSVYREEGLLFSMRSRLLFLGRYGILLQLGRFGRLVLCSGSWDLGSRGC